MATFELEKALTAKQFDEKFDNGEDMSMYLDFSKAIRLKDIDQLSMKTQFIKDKVVKILKESHGNSKT